MANNIVRRRTLLTHRKKNVNVSSHNFPAFSLIQFYYPESKSDDRPNVLVLYDDELGNIEGINLNYLSDVMYKKLLNSLASLSEGIDLQNKEAGLDLYERLRKEFDDIHVAYRKYKRSKMTSLMLYDRRETT